MRRMTRATRARIHETASAAALAFAGSFALGMILTVLVLE